MLDKWKKAVIHVECATDKEHIYDKIKRDRELFEQSESEEISQDELMEKRLLIWGESREIRCRGTALFLSDNSKRYLVTARHVVGIKNQQKENFRKKWKEGCRGHQLQKKN